MYANLDPDSDGFAVLLCARCHQAAGWENTHSDEGHDTTPDPGCPICQESDTNTDSPLTVTFADDAHESFEGFVVDKAHAGYHVRLDGLAVRLDGLAVRLDGYDDGHLVFHVTDGDSEPIGEQRRVPLRDGHGLLTVTHVEVL